MAKKLLNQNAKYDQKFIGTIEPNFVFDSKPINRLKIFKNNISNVKEDKKNKILQLSLIHI
mgnify:FL=1